ncbi:MAG: patatin-like phospholipase family protein [Gammaproteobacteria bacterium]|nr:patatin-like phospholipase family protein [Gammaproteobacteria bacterium]NNM14678.1 patatin-like phospholipase family protein [Gammaproteobacteria bacterium]
MSQTNSNPKASRQLSSQSRALILPGGGARAAYQVGVLKAIAELLPDVQTSPFRVYSGTSAGAINSTVLASHAMDFHQGMQNLEAVWNNFKVNHVYKTNTMTVIKNTAHWLWTILSAGRFGKKPTSLLDNQPLRELLQKQVNFSGIEQGLQQQLIDGLIIVCSAYSTAQSVNFFQARDTQNAWQRFRRVGVPSRIEVEHLMASVAIPYVFPAVQVGEQYYADGAVRQAKPLSAALHLGANRLMVIGVRDEKPNYISTQDQVYPSLGKVAGYILDTLFMDGLFTDLEHLLHVNRLLENFDSNLVPEKPVDVHIIVPSSDIRDIALKHQHRLPRSVRIFMAGAGARDKISGSQLVSYLLFEQDYTRDLISLGYCDAMEQKDALIDFFCSETITRLEAPQRIKDQLQAGGLG